MRCRLKSRSFFLAIAGVTCRVWPLSSLSALWLDRLGSTALDSKQRWLRALQLSYLARVCVFAVPTATARALMRSSNEAQTPANSFSGHPRSANDPPIVQTGRIDGDVLIKPIFGN